MEIFGQDQGLSISPLGAGSVVRIEFWVSVVAGLVEDGSAREKTRGMAISEAAGHRNQLWLKPEANKDFTSGGDGGSPDGRARDGAEGIRRSRGSWWQELPSVPLR